MSKEYKILQEAYDSIKKKIPYVPEVAITLGSGLGDFVNNLKIDSVIDYKDIKNFPKATNQNHKGKFVFTQINGVKTLVMQGRIHFYEGYSAAEAVRPVRLMAMMGVKKFIVTNAAGTCNKNYKVGDLMIIKDHISFFAPNPLIGENVEELGTRFPDMTDIYDKDIIKVMKKVATKNKIKMQEGVYIQLKGPSFETATEIKIAGKLGADAVGMSTVIEVIAARHAGLRVGGISVITNMGTGLSKVKLSDDDVRETANKIAKKFEKLVIGIIGNLK
ncbi:MAG: purine-nucleoside phosphorylase [Lachnospiraceae bacterium]|nr:purine-nucleoside phosphorylase [Lachnospiraceae bacterium]